MDKSSLCHQVVLLILPSFAHLPKPASPVYTPTCQIVLEPLSPWGRVVLTLVYPMGFTTVACKGNRGI